MTKSVWIGLMGVLLRAAALGMVLALSACGGGGSSESVGLTAPTEVTLSALGIQSFQFGADGTSASVMQGLNQRADLQFASDAVVTFNVTAKAAMPITAASAGSGRWALNLDTSGIAAGTTVPVELTFTDTRGNRAAKVIVNLNVIATAVTTASLSSAGGVVEVAGVKVKFLPSGITAPVSVSISKADLPGSTAHLLRIEFDKDMSGTGLKFLLPNTGNELGFQSTSSSRLSVERQTEPVKSAVTKEDFIKEWSVGGYPTNNNYLGKMWASWNGYYVMSSARNEFTKEKVEWGTVRVPYAAIQAGKVSDFFFAPISELQSTVSRGYGTDVWKNYEPVLFIHGFNANSIRTCDSESMNRHTCSLSAGGGSGTWGNFPKLAQLTVNSTGDRTLVPFEFRWNTSASFRDVGDDLEAMIALIYRQTGKKVHVVAHSFGGVLIRTVLQEFSRTNTACKNDPKIKACAKYYVASVMTLGSPHSGIFANDNAIINGRAFPNGQDAVSFEFCSQLSCHEMGEPVTSLPERIFDNVDLIAKDPGSIAVSLDLTADQLPSIPINVGIGMSNSSLVLAGVPVPKFDTGDYLISFKGQRFNPAAGTLVAPFLKHKVGKAVVTEFILGTTSWVIPSDPTEGKLINQDVRPRGYLHSSWTGPGNVATSDAGVLGWGLEAQISDSCADDTCQHSSYLGFRKLMKEVDASKPIAAFSASTFTPRTGETVIFDAKTSTDLGGTITTYNWDFGDGQSGTGMAPSHSYLNVATYVVTLTVSDNNQQRANTSKSIVVSAAPPPASKFIDNFDGGTLDTQKWAVSTATTTCCGPGIPAAYSVASGFLNISVLGGSCGFCGVGDGSKFTPRINSLTGDFESYISFTELTRTSRDGTGPMNSLTLSATSGSSGFGVYVVGDVLNNSGTRGHNIYVFAGGNIINSGTRSLSVGQFYAMEFRIRRVGLTYYMGYKVAGDVDWTEANYAGFPSGLSMVPSFAAGAGDGGGTRINSSASFRIDTFTVSGSP